MLPAAPPNRDEPRRAQRSTWLWVALLCLTGCSRPDSSRQPEGNTAGPNATARAAAATASEPTRTSDLNDVLRRCAEREGASAKECDEPLQRLAAPLVQLDIAGSRHEATHVYFCRQLERQDRERDPWRCASSATHADDTLHTVEFDHHLVDLPAGTKARLVAADGRGPDDLIKAGAGPALQMHVDGYAAARRLNVTADGAIPVAEIPTGPRCLLFALYRHDATWVRKHVWVVQQRAADAGTPHGRR